MTFGDFKEENEAFRPPPPPCNVVPLFELHVPVGTTNTSTLKGGEGEGVVLG